jgi:hypothetical protein
MACPDENVKKQLITRQTTRKILETACFANSPFLDYLKPKVPQNQTHKAWITPKSQLTQAPLLTEGMVTGRRTESRGVRISPNVNAFWVTDYEASFHGGYLHIMIYSSGMEWIASNRKQIQEIEELNTYERQELFDYMDHCRPEKPTQKENKPVADIVRYRELTTTMTIEIASFLGLPIKLIEIQSEDLKGRLADCFDPRDNDLDLMKVHHVAYDIERS